MIEDLVFSIDDFKRLLQKKKSKLMIIMLLSSCLTALYSFSSSPKFESIATYKQSSIDQDQNYDLKSFFQAFSQTSLNNLSIPIILSRNILFQLIEQLGLQAKICNEGFFHRTFRNIRDNIRAELSLPISKLEPFGFSNLCYEGNKTLVYYLKLTTPFQYEIYDKKKNKLCENDLGRSIVLENGTLSFTLSSIPTNYQLDHLYLLKILPKLDLFNKYKKQIRINPIPQDKTILEFKLQEPYPSTAASILNTLMNTVEKYLIKKNEKLLSFQLDYLHQRQDELSEKLNLAVKNHAELLKTNFQQYNFLGIKEELNLIMTPFQEYQKRLNEIELQKASLENHLPITLRSSNPLDNPKLLQQFSHHLKEQIEETSLLIQNLHQDKPLILRVLPQETFGNLLKDIEKFKQLWISSQTETYRQLYQERRQQLTTYLENFLSHLNQRQKSLQEGMFYIKENDLDFQGLSLQDARGLFQKYCLEFDHLHEELKQLIFFRDHLHEPQFEISTLSNILTDSVTQQLIQKSSELETQLCDAINRSDKEHQRFKEALAMNKKFLSTHLYQTLELGKIRLQLLREKIHTVYTTICQLLNKEKEILELKILDSKKSLAHIPEIWNQEKQLHFKSELTKGMMEGLIQIIESKNLKRRLYQADSQTLDCAFVSPKAVRPYVLIKTGIVGILIALAYFSYSALYLFFKGFPVSLKTLSIMGFPTFGTLAPGFDLPFSSLSEHNLNVLRSMSRFLLKFEDTKSKTIALISEKGSHFYENIFHLLKLQNYKILLVDCRFDRIVKPQDQPGLYHYLQSIIPDLPIRRFDHYDFIPAGYNTQFTTELLSLSSFQIFLEKMHNDYDFIFLLHQASLTSTESLEALLKCNAAIITVAEESYEVLSPYIQKARQASIYLGFTQYSATTEPIFIFS